MTKYTIVVVGTDFGISDFLSALYRRFPYVVSGIPKREPGRYEAQVHFSKSVNDEQLQCYLSLEHPYVAFGISNTEVVTYVLANACCCEESARL